MEKVHDVCNYINVIISFIAEIQIDLKRHCARTSELPSANSIPWEKIQTKRKETPFPKLSDVYKLVKFASTGTNDWYQINALIDILNSTEDSDEFKVAVNTIQKVIQGRSFSTQNMFFAGEKFHPIQVVVRETVPE